MCLLMMLWLILNIGGPVLILLSRNEVVPPPAGWLGLGMTISGLLLWFYLGRKYTLDEVELPFNPLEESALKVLQRLHDAQVRYKTSDMSKSWPAKSVFQMLASDLWTSIRHPRLSRKEEIRMFVEKYSSEYSEIPPLKPPLPLGELWQRIKPPKRFAPHRIDENDIVFDEFTICYRVVDKDGPRRDAYLALIPTGEREMHCIVASGPWEDRHFYSQQTFRNCSLPGPEDHQHLRLRSRGFDCESELTVPCVLDCYVPDELGPWEIVNYPDASKPPETIIDDEDDQDRGNVIAK